MKQKIVLQDNLTGKSFSFGLQSDAIAKDIVLLVPEEDGTILLEENIGRYLTDNILGNLRGYTGSQGMTGQNFRISKTFNSLAELLAGTTDNETFGLVAGTLPLTHTDYGKLYHYQAGVWTYITDLSVEGAAGVQGPLGYTGSQGTTGYTGSTGDVGPIGPAGSKGDIGYTGSTGGTGPQGPTGPQGIVGFVGSRGATGYNGSIGATGPQGNTGATGASGVVSTTTLNAIGAHVLARAYSGLSGESVNKTNYSYGGYIAGSGLYPCSALSQMNLSGNNISGSSTALPGTWMALSQGQDLTSGFGSTGLFVRIA